jgi:hypothetical protein
MDGCGKLKWMDPRDKPEDDKLWSGWFVLFRSRKQPAAAHFYWSNSLSAFGGPFSDHE